MDKFRPPWMRSKWPKEKKARSDAHLTQIGGSGYVSAAENESEHIAPSNSRGSLSLDGFLKRLGRSREPSPHPGPEESAQIPLPHAASATEANLQRDADSLDRIAIKGAITQAAADVEGIKQSNIAATVVTAIDNAGLMLDTIDPLVAPLAALRAFNLVVNAIAKVHPYAQIALVIFKGASKMILNQINLDTAVRSLLSKVSEVYGFVTETQYWSPMPATQALVLERLSRQVMDCVNFIVRYVETKNFWMRTSRNVLGDTNTAIEGYSRAIDNLMQQFRDNVIRDVAIFTCRAAEDLDLSGLEYAGGVGRNTLKQCLPDTRKAILSEIQDWVIDTASNAQQIFWLSGMAGTGKSTVAHTIAGWSDEHGSLGSCFCFDQTRKGERLSQKLFTTIARDLADHNPLVRRALASVIQDNNELKHTVDIRRQWIQLLLGPINVASEAIEAPILVIIDALDESGESDTREQILHLLTGRQDVSSQPLVCMPPNIRILVTSRPLEDIHGALHGLSHIRHVSLDEPPWSDTVDYDIECYFSSRLKELQFDGDDCRALAKRANGLFEWSRLACEYIKGRNTVRQKPKARFKSVVSDEPTKRTTLLDSMYKRILADVILEDERKDAIPMFCTVMGLIVTMLEPLSRTVLNTIQRYSPCIDGIDQEQQDIDVEFILTPLGALLTGVTDTQIPIRPLHASFYDFLTDRDRSGDFFVGESAVHHYRLATACLRLMKVQLRFNICHLESSYLPNSSVIDLQKRIKESIMPELQYSSRFWITHVTAASFHSSLADEVHYLLDGERMLYWLEVLCLLKSLSGPASMLSTLWSWSQKDHNYTQLKAAVADTERFIRMFAAPMLYSTPHLYLSALPFAPALSRISARCAKFTRGITVATGGMNEWSSFQSTLQGHTSNVTSVTFSCDGRHIISGSDDQTICVWDMETGQQLCSPLEGHAGPVISVAISQDGRHIASGSHDKTVRVWDMKTGQQLGSPLEGHTGPVSSVAISHDGRQIVSGSRDNTIRVWDMVTRQELGSPLEGHTGPVMSVAISYDGRRIISGSLDKTIRVWDMEAGQQLGSPLQEHTGGVWSVAISYDGRRIVSGSHDKTIRVWDMDTGKQLSSPLEGHTEPVGSVAISHDGRYIVSGSDDNTIRVWDMQTGQQLGSPLEGHAGSVWSVAISHDGRHIVSGSYDNTVRVWDMKTGQQSDSPLEGRTGSVMSVAISYDGRCIVSGTDDKTIRVWDMETGQQLGYSLKGHTGPVGSVAISHDGRRIVSGSRDNTVRVWDMEVGQLGSPLKGHTGPVSFVAVSYDDRHIVSGSYDKTICVWDMETVQQLGSPLKGHTSTVRSVAISHDGRHIVSGSDDKTIRVWSVETRQQLGCPLEGHSGLILSVAISHDGQRIVSGSSDGTIRMWDIETRQQVGSTLEGHTGIISSVAISHDDRCIVSGSYDKTIRVWDMKTEQQLGSPLEGHTGPVLSVAISHDGRRIVSGSYDNVIRVWDAEPELQLIGPFLEEHTGVVNSIAHDAQCAMSDSVGETIQAQGKRSTTLVQNSTAVSPVVFPGHRGICFSLNLAHSLGSPASFLQGSPPPSLFPNDAGWLIGPEGRLLFWVPPHLQRTMHTPVTTMVIPSSGLQLDLSNFAHGELWQDCRSRD
ncbi:uncharacterized protein FIBRA_08817 [Fibroporia radiculosa]|uniref:Nephrocystin 3-like N-terminal domain-containing protein n=1 Tax=Fibroporia radiculosa TaxID=599839 RepID=J4GIB1_9APHY|nr:uncharacterized protein FIBRA_08817 [Fibroporia radiculosa]CCM06543.1 predicted protein [Fibroporia radiculosa]